MLLRFIILIAISIAAICCVKHHLVGELLSAMAGIVSEKVAFNAFRAAFINETRQVVKGEFEKDFGSPDELGKEEKARRNQDVENQVQKRLRAKWKDCADRSAYYTEGCGSALGACEVGACRAGCAAYTALCRAQVLATVRAEQPDATHAQLRGVVEKRCRHACSELPPEQKLIYEFAPRQESASNGEGGRLQGDLAVLKAYVDKALADLPAAIAGEVGGEPCQNGVPQCGCGSDGCDAVCGSDDGCDGDVARDLGEGEVETTAKHNRARNRKGEELAFNDLLASGGGRRVQKSRIASFRDTLGEAIGSQGGVHDMVAVLRKALSTDEWQQFMRIIAEERRAKEEKDSP